MAPPGAMNTTDPCVKWGILDLDENVLTPPIVWFPDNINYISQEQIFDKWDLAMSIPFTVVRVSFVDVANDKYLFG